MDENSPDSVQRVSLNTSLIPRDSSLAKDALLQNCFVDNSTAGVAYTTKRPGFYVGTEAITTGLYRGVYYNPYDGGTYYIDENEMLQRIETVEINLVQTGFQTLGSLGPTWSTYFVSVIGNTSAAGYGIRFKETAPSSGLYEISFGRFTNVVSVTNFGFTPLTTVSTGITPADIYSIVRTESPLSNVVNFYVNFTKVGSFPYVRYDEGSSTLQIGQLGSSYGPTPP
jgi:hypothetical protein